MKPTTEGVYEWFDDKGTKRLVEVIDASMGDDEKPYLRVYFDGGYYNVHDQHDPEHPEYDWATKAEWPDRWGKRIGDNYCVPDTDLYLTPSEE